MRFVPTLRTKVSSTSTKTINGIFSRYCVVGIRFFFGGALSSVFSSSAKIRAAIREASYVTALTHRSPVKGDAGFQPEARIASLAFPLY